VVTEDPFSYWKFAQAVKERTRFIFDHQTQAFLDHVRQESKGRIKSIKKDKIFWRARAAFSWREVPISEDDFTDVPAPCTPEEMLPKNEHAKEGGRANPPGIAYLYGASNPETALAECRPWLHEEITLGLFKADRDLRVVVCDQQPDDTDIFSELEGTLKDEQRKNRVWADIGAAFSVPVNRNDAAVSYIPTQILAEAFKAEGADGLAILFCDGPSLASRTYPATQALSGPKSVTRSSS
jgi:hypothetical protein